MHSHVLNHKIYACKFQEISISKRILLAREKFSYIVKIL